MSFDLFSQPKKENMASATIFKNFNQKVENLSLIAISKRIENGTYKSEIENIRTLVDLGKSDEASEAKKQLLGFTPSGTFDNGRNAKAITTYNQHIVLDFDKIGKDKVAEKRQKAASIPHTFCAFISPSGNGLKILVLVSSGLESHNVAIKQVSDYYAKELNIEIDSSGKDVSRLCFMSYDPDLYKNINPTPFPVSIELLSNKSIEIPLKIETNFPNNIELESNNFIIENNWSEKFIQCVEFTKKKETYNEGNRNNFIHLLACNCNRNGIPESEAQQLIDSNYDLKDAEIFTTVKSAYQNNLHDFAKLANIANLDSQSKDEQLLNMPFIPENIFEKLPNILKIGCEVLTDLRERDIFLTSSLAILSGCMPNIKGLYMGKEVYSNLFVFVIAPAASGKGSLTYAKQLGDKYHNFLVDESKKARKIYEMEIAEYNRKIKDKKADLSSLEVPVEPPFKVLFIPANNSTSRVIQHLQEGDEQGIFCETEADTMGNVFKQDWGSYSDLLRKAFHHELVSFSRKTNKEWIEIKKPRLSVALAGTPSQVVNLISSAEDGLFSRFIFYTFKSEIKWNNVGPADNKINYTKHYEILAESVYDFVSFLTQNPEISFDLTTEQWAKLNSFGNDCINNLASFVSEDLSSTSKRLGLILFRISMVLTALRYYDNAESSTNFICSDEDFAIALQMIKVYQEHAVFMFGELPKSCTVTDKNLRMFFDLLPQNFERKAAIEIAKNNLSIKDRTADGFLQKLVTLKWLDKLKSGKYIKLK